MFMSSSGKIGISIGKIVVEKSLAWLFGSGPGIYGLDDGQVEFYLPKQ
jgi:hypothetical protein